MNNPEKNGPFRFGNSPGALRLAEIVVEVNDYIQTHKVARTLIGFDVTVKAIKSITAYQGTELQSKVQMSLLTASYKQARELVKAWNSNEENAATLTKLKNFSLNVLKYKYLDAAKIIGGKNFFAGNNSVPK